MFGCGPIPDRLREKLCVYAVDSNDERTINLCVWRCLAIEKRAEVERGTEFFAMPALTLAQEYYGNPKLKRKDVRQTKLIEIKGIAKPFKVNIRVYDPETNSEKTLWRLVYGKKQYKQALPDITLIMVRGFDKDAGV